MNYRNEYGRIMFACAIGTFFAFGAMGGGGVAATGDSSEAGISTSASARPGLEFLASYPSLKQLSLDMTERKFLAIAEQEKLKPQKAVAGGHNRYLVSADDHHVVIVMFRQDGSCAGIQRMRADNGRPEARILREPAFRLPDHWIVMGVGFDKDSSELVTASFQYTTTIRRWDVRGRKLISEIKLAADKHGRSVREDTLILSGDRRRVIAATDAYVGIWDTATGELVRMLPIPEIGANDTVRLLTCTPDLSVIVADVQTNYSRTTLAYDAYAVVWDGTSGKQLRTITDKNANDFIAIDLSADGKLLATTNGGGARVWDVGSGKLLREFSNDNRGRKHSDPEVTNQFIDHVWSLRFSPDGKQLAYGDTLGVRVADIESGQVVHLLEAPYRYGGHVKLVFSKDGGLLARIGTSMKTAKTVPVWSTHTGEMRYELYTDSSDGAFSGDGQQMATVRDDFKMGLSVWQLGGTAVDGDLGIQPVPESSQDRVAENTHYRGKKAAEFVERWKPKWGKEQHGIQYGAALTRQQREFRIGERVTLAAFFRNASDKPIQIDVRPDYFWDMPNVIDAKGRAIELEKVALLGTGSHYREKLQPGETLGPLYFNFGLGTNPRPEKQPWTPYYKVPVAGKYTLTHTVAVEVASIDVRDDSPHDRWTPGELTTGSIEFEIAR